MTRKQMQARSKGGLARAQKYSHEQIVKWSKLGTGRGRPRSLDLEDLLALENKFQKGGKANRVTAGVM